MKFTFNTVLRAAFLLIAAVAASLASVTQTQMQTPPPLPTSATQTPPAASEDIFVVAVTGSKGKPGFGQPTNITNRAGYDNQPAFLPDGQSLLYTSQREGDQTDIYRYDFKTLQSTRLTATPEGEYSPTIMPGGKFFSVIRVEADKTQRLWKFPLAGGEPALLLPNLKPVGYHLWLDERTLALFILGANGRPNTLQLAPTDNSFLDTIHVNIGRALHLIPRRAAFSFVHKISPDEWLVKAFDLKTKRSATLARTLPGSEDLAWTPDGTILMAQDSKLYQLDPAQPSAGWQLVADFTAAGLKKITRLALSPKADRLALVAQSEAAR
jgi:dipeptidyl aminopeptidase/acylaminoacyl peptidase